MPGDGESAKETEMDATRSAPVTTLSDAAPRQGMRERLVAGGSLLGAIGTASCCVLPLVLFTLGLSGAWIGALLALEPYQPYFVAVTLALLGVGYWLVYGRPKRACAEGEACARPMSGRLVETSLWTATVLVVVAIAFPYFGPMLLGV